MLSTQRPVKKAVIPAAGLGTRFLPFTKAVPKEMLPIIDRPVIQYVVEEAVAGGIEDILIVTSADKKAIEDHFDRHLRLEEALRGSGRAEEADGLKALAELADIHFVRQGEARGLGHAVGTARRHIGDDPFVVLLGDSIMGPGATVIPDMIEAYHSRTCSVVALMPVPPQDVGAYGCAGGTEIERGWLQIDELVEKPAPEQAPSNLVIRGRYLLTSAVFDLLDSTKPGVGGEIQLTDALVGLIDIEGVLGVVGTEGRYDTGNKFDYLKAVVEMALERPDVGPAFATLLDDIVGQRGLDEPAVREV